MLPVTYYILKVIICSAVLTGYYWFFLRNKIFHGYNRFYLLVTVIVSMALPLMKFDVMHNAEEAKTSVVKMLQVVNNGDAYMDEIIIRNQYSDVSKESVAGWAFAAVSLIMLISFALTIRRILLLKYGHPRQLYDGISLIHTNDPRTPFSFFKNIFWNDDIDINSTNGKRILRHELAHVNEKHSFDKLFINSVLILFWCNPFFWLIRKELTMIHEFIADKKAVEDGDTAAFAAMILQATYPRHKFELTNNFFYSPIKRRLAMLTKDNKAKVSYISRLLVLPMVVIVFAAFTIKAKTYLASSAAAKVITVVIDAGHGGIDNGGVALDGSLEKNLNLSLAKKIKEMNSDASINIILTRETDIYQEPKQKTDFATKMKADLFLSIHHNSKFPDTSPSATGMEVMVSQSNFGNSEKSKLLASAIISAFQKNYGLPVFSAPIQRETGIWILQATQFPSVLIEGGFLSNKEDMAYLQSAVGKEQFARNVLNAISIYRASHQQLPVQEMNSEDSVPIKRAEKRTGSPATFSNATIITDFTGVFDIKADAIDANTAKGNSDALFIVNGKELKAADIANKKIVAKKGKFYQENNADMVKKYGSKARKGVLILEDATVTDIQASPNYSASLNRVIADTLISANQEITINGQNYTALKRRLDLGIDEKISPLYLVNGKQTEMSTIRQVSMTRIQYANTLSSGDAIKKYGDPGKNGAVEIFINADPSLTLSGISDSRINTSQLKNIKELKCDNPAFIVASAGVYFSGAGFENVIFATLQGESLSSIQQYLDRIESGSNVTFDNIRVTKRNGEEMMTIAGKTFSFF